MFIFSSTTYVILNCQKNIFPCRNLTKGRLKRSRGYEPPLELIKTIYPRSKGSTDELYSSSRRTVVVPLLKNYMQFFLFIFLGWVMLPQPQATSTARIMVGLEPPTLPMTSRDVNTSPMHPLSPNSCFN